MARAARKQNPEEALQEHVVTFARAALTPPTMMWSTPNGGRRSKREAAMFKATGTLAGIPDLFFLRHGRLLGVELKAPPKTLKRGVSRAKPRVSDEQLAVHERLSANGVPTVVCRSVEEVERALRIHGFALRASVMAR